MSFQYINQAYGLSIKRGTRVRYIGDVSKRSRLGAVTSADGQYINIRFDDTGRVEGPFHPRWELTYNPAEGATP